MSRANDIKLKLVSEQAWYKEQVGLARRIQDWILKNLGGYTSSGSEIHMKYDEEYGDEAVDKAIEILRANAALYPMTNDMYTINMSRMSSARL